MFLHPLQVPWLLFTHITIFTYYLVHKNMCTVSDMLTMPEDWAFLESQITVPIKKKKKKLNTVWVVFQASLCLSPSYICGLLPLYIPVLSGELSPDFQGNSDLPGRHSLLMWSWRWDWDFPLAHPCPPQSGVTDSITFISLGKSLMRKGVGLAVRDNLWKRRK